LGEITEGDPLRQFAGYHGNKEATSKKVARDVFKKGDQFFRTGMCHTVVIIL
jgi:fatty-acyl-CoA synthase